MSVNNFYLPQKPLSRAELFGVVYSIRKGFWCFSWLPGGLKIVSVGGHLQPLDLIWGIKRETDKQSDRERERWRCILSSSLLESFVFGGRSEGNVKNAQIAVCNSSGPSRLLLPLRVASCKLLLHLQTIANNYLCGPGAARWSPREEWLPLGIGYCATPPAPFFLAHQAVNDQSTWSSANP